RRMPAMTAGHNKEETAKRWDAAVLSGQPLVCMDNLNGEIGGENLSSFITNPTGRIRVFGTPNTPAHDTPATTCVASGIGIHPREDFVRRTLICRISPMTENPETRRFKFDPLAVAQKFRARYVAAVIAIARFYIKAGRPRTAVEGINLGSFGEWCEVVR